MGEFSIGPGPVVMGVLNVTPDSFSDGGRYTDRAAAVAHGVELWRQGADLVDVGGESTRPGADRVDAETEISRVVPVLEELAAAGVAVSVDTTRAAVAEAALAAGASVVNDVSGGLADPAMTKVVADANCPYVIMHWRGHARRMTELARYRDVVTDVCAELRARVDEALAAGVAADRIVIDPGLGFAKTATHNWQLTQRIDELVALGFPVLVGASRKSYLGRLLPDPTGAPRPVAEREAATIATSVLAIAAGAWGVRVHDVRNTRDALAVWQASGRPRLSRTGPGAVPTSRAVPTSGTAPTDTITLTGLRAHGRHGVYEFERDQGQEFILDVVLEVDLARAGASDALTDTVDYGGLADRLMAVLTGPPVALIETLATRLAEVCLTDPRVAAATITVHKPAAPIPHPFTDVAVTRRLTRRLTRPGRTGHA